MLLGGTNPVCVSRNVCVRVLGLSVLAERGVTLYLYVATVHIHLRT